MRSAGDLRESVRFQQRTLDANEDRLGPWDAEGLLLRAEVVSKLGTEPVLQQRLIGIQPVGVTIRLSRASAKIDTSWRMLWRDQAYDLKTVAPDYRSRLIQILAVADQTTPGTLA